MKFILLILVTTISFSIEYDLDSLIEIGIENSPIIKLSKEERKKSIANSIEARSSALPKIQFITSGTRNYNVAAQPMKFPVPFGMIDPETGMPIPTDFNPGLQQTSIQEYEMMFSMGRDYSGVYGLNINQTLFDGRVFAAIRASDIYRNMTNESYNVDIEKVIEKIKISYYSVLLSRKVTEVFQKSVERASNNFKNTELLFKSGKVNELELIRTETMVKDQETLLTNAKNNEFLALENLILTVGITEKDTIKIVGKFDDVNPSIPNFEDLKEILMENQPLIKQLDANSKLMKVNISSYLSEFLPSIGLSGSFHKMQSNNKKEFTSENFQDNSSISVNIGLPIFDGFGTSARVMRAKADAKKAEYQADDVKNNLLLELKSIHLTIIESVEKINAGNKKLELANKGYEIAKDLYKNGMTTQLELLGAEIGLNQAELNLLQANFEYQVAMANLSRAIGENTNGEYK